MLNELLGDVSSVHRCIGMARPPHELGYILTCVTCCQSELQQISDAKESGRK